jgi:hypothetical protein
LICDSDLMRPKGYPISKHGRTRLNGRLRLYRGGAAPWPASPEFRSGRYGARRLYGFLALNRAEGKGILTWGTLTVGWAPRQLTTSACFVLLGSVHGFSNGPPVKVRAPTGAAASPQARRGLQLWRATAEISTRQWRLGQRRRLSLGPNFARYRALFIGVSYRIIDGKNPNTFLV